MKITGIVAEFNPYHNGHRYLTEQIRQAGGSHIVAVMSGSFVQRGEPAVFSKWQRAQTALAHGIDLVLELPVAYALGSAERFAAGAVSLLHALGCVELLAFGSESGDTALLQKAADACIMAEASELIRTFLKEGLSYPVARARTVASFGGTILSDLLSAPNNTLGIEYLKAAQKQQCGFQVFTIKRHGAAHDGIPYDGIASASWLRKEIQRGHKVSAYLPNQEQGETAADAMRLEQVVLWQLRQMTKAAFAALPDVTEGLENRLWAAAQTAQSVTGFLEAVKTRRYTLARLRRILWYAALGLKKADCAALPAYLRVLGMNDRGREILQKAKQTAALPLVSSFVKLEQLAPRSAMLEKKASDLRELAVSPPAPCNRDYTEKVIIAE